MAFDVAELSATISVDTREAERGLQRFSQRLPDVGRRYAADTVRTLYAEDDWVIALFDASGTARDGKPYHNTYS
jgi:ketosteroid isomerase-like protein